MVRVPFREDIGGIHPLSERRGEREREGVAGKGQRRLAIDTSITVTNERAAVSEREREERGWPHLKKRCCETLLYKVHLFIEQGSEDKQ